MKTISFMGRNIRRYVREPGTVALSFLSVFVVFGLYALVLSQVQISGAQNMMGQQLKDMNLVIMHWVLGGLLCIPAVSVPLTILYFKVYDVVDFIQDDFFVTPAKRVNYILGYALSAWICGFFMTLVTLFLGELYIVANGGQLLSIITLMKVILIIAIAILSFTGFSFFVIMFLKSKSSLTLVTTIFNTLIGFLAGLYVPIGSLSDGIEFVFKIFPLAQIAALLRQVIMADVIKDVFRNIPNKQLVEFKQYYGIDIIISNHQLSATEIIIISIVFGTVFYLSLIAIVNHRKK